MDTFYLKRQKGHPKIKLRRLNLISGIALDPAQGYFLSKEHLHPQSQTLNYCTQV